MSDRPDKNFFFGASTSAHQVEGGTKNDWTEWEIKNALNFARIAKENPPEGGWQRHVLDLRPSPLDERNYISGIAADHYHRFEEDFDIAQSLGHNAHRFSIEWSRIEPEKGKFNEKEIEHYRKVIRALRARGLEPFVTLWHFTLPVWLAREGGVQNTQFPKYFERYAERLAREFKDDVRFWIPLNEPEVFSMLAYFTRTWPPHERGFFRALKAGRTLAKAHNLAYAAIKKHVPQAQVGPLINVIHFESAKGMFNEWLKAIGDYLWNSYFFNHAGACADFIGINYYFHNKIDGGFNRNANEKVSDVGWELYPEGIYHVIKDVQKYNLPIYITENGLADARDTNREFFLTGHLAAIRRAIAEGADVRGYFHWSLLDNFEWEKGFWPRFGLVEVDYDTLERKIRPSAFAYKKAIEAWQNSEHEKEITFIDPEKSFAKKDSAAARHTALER